VTLSRSRGYISITPPIGALLGAGSKALAFDAGSAAAICDELGASWWRLPFAIKSLSASNLERNVNVKTAGARARIELRSVAL
jgi:hypothetical protein